MIKIQTNEYDSSTIKSSTYDYLLKNLYVVFGHATYVYKNVSESDYNLFAGGESQGISLNKFIKGVYEYERLEMKIKN